MAGFYVATGILAALVGLGAWLYRPLATRYAIHRVRSAPSFREVSDWQVRLVTEAAVAGNRSAFEAMFAPGYPTLTTFVVMRFPTLSADARAVFYQVLMTQSHDRYVLLVLEWLAYGIRMQDENGDLCDETGTTDAVAELLGEMEQLEKAFAGPRTMELAAEMHEFVRRRFAKELEKK